MPLCWDKVGDGELLGPEIVRETSEKIQFIREKMRAVQSHHKTYADKHRKDLEFKVGKHVFLKVPLVQGVVRFRQKRGKLSPRYIRLFKI